MNEPIIKPVYPTDTRVVYCFTNNCTSRNECALAHISNQRDHFFGQGGDKERCTDFMELKSA